MNVFAKVWVIFMAAITVVGFTTGCILHSVDGKDYAGYVFASLVLGFFSLLVPCGWDDNDLPLLTISSMGFMGNLAVVGYLIFLATM